MINKQTTKLLNNIKLVYTHKKKNIKLKKHKVTTLLNLVKANIIVNKDKVNLKLNYVKNQPIVGCLNNLKKFC